MAFGALHAATRLGLKVPRDLSIIGFDDIPQAAGSTPALTTVRQPSRAKGQVAAAIVTGDLPYTAEFQELATELIVRESATLLTQLPRKRSSLTPRLGLPISQSRFSLPTLAGSPGATRHNKGNQK
jgi:LacI family transcriptional regulator